MELNLRVRKALTTLGYTDFRGLKVLDNNKGLNNKLSIITEDECIVFSFADSETINSVAVFIKIPSQCEIISETKYGFLLRKNGYIARFNGQNVLLNNDGKIIKGLS